MTTISRITRYGLLAALAMILPASAQLAANPLARGPYATPRNVLLDDLLAGSWNGANLENRSNCSATQNNGAHGTYAQYVVSFDRTGLIMGINETAITGLNCTYFGTYGNDPILEQWTGNYSCSDGKTGSFTMQGLLAAQNSLYLRLAIKLSGTETCNVDAILGGSRF